MSDTATQARLHISDHHMMTVIFRMRLTMTKLRICSMSFTYGDWRPFASRYSVYDITN